MTKNTLAAALMVGVVGVVVAVLIGAAYLSIHHPNVVALFIVAGFSAIALLLFWRACQDLAQGIIEARRKRGEGNSKWTGN